MSALPAGATVVAALDELADGEARRVEVAGRSIALVRLGDRVYAIGDTCSHAKVSLSAGEVHRDECAIECERHGSLFSLETGAPTSLPATRPVPTYAVEVVDGQVIVNVEAGS